MEKQNNQTQASVGENANTWVFIPLMKKNIIKRTETYVLFNVDGIASGIINAKFLRKKESEDCVFVSLPSDYEITCRVKEYQAGKGWQTTREYVIKAVDLKPIILDFNKVCKVQENEKLPF